MPDPKTEDSDAIQAFLATKLDQYLAWRTRPEWGEGYKWDILRDLSAQLRVYKSATLDNIDHIITAYDTSMPAQGPFVHYSFLTDLKVGLTSSKQAVVDTIQGIWTDDHASASANYSLYSHNHRALGNPGLSYIAAGWDPVYNPLFRGELAYGLNQDLGYELIPGSGPDVYRVYREVVQFIGSAISDPLRAAGIPEDFLHYPAIVGQDFLFHLYYRWNETRILGVTKQFVKQAQTDDQSYKQYKQQYYNCDVSARFGQGSLYQVPWLTFDTFNLGFSPTFLYYKELGTLILAYDHSHNDDPAHTWSGIEDKQTIDEYFATHGQKAPHFGTASVYAVYDPDNLPDSLVADVRAILNEYKEQAKAILEHRQANPPKVQEPATVNTVSTAKPNKPSLPLNTIFYGPPGTGKTYSVMTKYAPELLAGQIAPEKTAEEVLAERLQDLTWWQVIALALAEAGRPLRVNDLRDHIVLKAYTTYVKQRTTSITPTLWSTLQARSDDHSSNMANKFDGEPIFTKSSGSSWTLTEAGHTYVQEALSSISLDAQPVAKSGLEKFCRTITFHQSYSYEEFIEGIRPVLAKGELEDESQTIRYEIRSGIFKQLCKEAEDDPGNNYVLIIDEINRGNIAKIFGELITLLEDNKRLDAKNAMTVTLPYSNATFGIPGNLYVIGTMNTADRSIALLDIALRRRFSFRPVMPIYKDLPTIDGIDTAKLLVQINEKIQIMLDQDHQIGHSSFIDLKDIDELKAVWYGSVIPLLQEYFYNDWTSLRVLLGEYKNNTGFIDGVLPEYVKTLFRGNRDYTETNIGTIHNYASTDAFTKAMKALYADVDTAA
ncbi:MAG TPA: AAA family ATPase [Candidatus Saccharimonadales bacterium]|jgi:hypothetical protein